MMSDVLFHIPDIVCKMSVVLVKSGFFSHPCFQSCSRELCVPCLTYIFGKLGREQLGGCGLWFLSFFEHAAWSRMAQVLLLCLSSHALVVTCSAWGWSQAAVSHHCHELQQQAWLLQQAKSACIYELEWPRLWFWVMWSYVARLGWTFTPDITILLLKEGSVMVWLDVQPAFIKQWMHEHSPLHSHISPGEEQLLWEVFFIQFLTGGYRLPQKIFKYILLETVNALEKWAETAWECSIGASVWAQLLNFRNSMVHCTCNQSDFCLADRKHSKPQNQHNVLRGVNSWSVHYFT